MLDLQMATFVNNKKAGFKYIRATQDTVGAYYALEKVKQNEKIYYIHDVFCKPIATI